MVKKFTCLDLQFIPYRGDWTNGTLAVNSDLVRPPRYYPNLIEARTKESPTNQPLRLTPHY